MNIPADKKLWKKVTESKPTPYDLVLVALKRDKVVAGWWTGTSWDGRRLQEDDEILAYKCFEQQTNNAKRYP